MSYDENRISDLIDGGLYKKAEQDAKKETYFAKCESTNEHYTFRAESLEDARHWVINHLDTSNVWTVGPIANHVPKQLPYCTDNGHEYEVHVNAITNTAHVHCKTQDNTADSMELITEKDVLDIIETAKTFGIKTVILHTNYGVEVHSHTLKTAKRFNGFYINKLTD